MKKYILLKKLIALFISFCFICQAYSQYWQQRVNYIIDVTLNDKEKSLDAFEKIIYFNNSPDTLDYIWFHLWPNAYKNDLTAFSDQLIENGNTAFYFSSKEERGYINRLDFKVNGSTAKTEDHPRHIDIIRVLLPEPLPPQQQIEITTPFHVKLPYNFSRGGYDGETFQLTQWYPKPAVYDHNGWHPMPYLDQGEFYSEFGSFDVRITVPSNYVIAATGELQNEEEKDWLRTRKEFSWEPVTTIIKKNSNTPSKKITQQYPTSSSGTKTLRYLQEHVPDFAWFADKRFKVHMDTCRLPSGKVVELFTYYTRENFKLWDNGFNYLKDALRFYSNEVAEYPYNTISVVHGPESFGGGMEYPTITLLAPVDSEKDLDRLIAHEVGHNWFQTILGSNERDHPWMDEGINSFYEYKYMDSRYGKESRMETFFYLTKAKRRTAQPIETKSQLFSTSNYSLVAYHRTATWLQEIEARIGEKSFREMMQVYFRTWKFKHPQPADFIHLLKTYTPENASQYIDALYKVPLPVSEGFQIISPLIKHSIKSYLHNPQKNILLLTPAIGVNSYDRLMAGAAISNYKLPPTKFNFLFTPMYATGSKNIAGLSRMNYSIITGGAIRKTDIFLNGSLFTMDDFKDTAGRKLFMRYRKLVPGIKLTFREKDPRSTINRFILWKTYLIKEASLRIFPDTTISGTDTSLFLRYMLPKKGRYLNQLMFVYENFRALYPFNLTVQAEQAQDFIRPSITTHYYFNYRKGGLQLRFFAGGFFYLNGKTIRKQFDNDRYLLNMTGPKGYEDYTYSDYFMGRNHFEGLESQQIMIRDGGFKVRTDLLANKIGKTDRWLTAINLNSTLPDKINPLSLLPVKIPLRLFLDIGTYADAWEKDAEDDRFLFDMGFHIPLFNEMINIYIPLFYNNVYSDYFKSTITKNRFLKTISFSFNFYNNDIRALNRDLEF